MLYYTVLYYTIQTLLMLSYTPPPIRRQHVSPRRRLDARDAGRADKTKYHKASDITVNRHNTQQPNT